MYQFIIYIYHLHHPGTTQQARQSLHMESSLFAHPKKNQKQYINFKIVLLLQRGNRPLLGWSHFSSNFQDKRYLSSTLSEFSRLNLWSSSAITAGSCFFLCFDILLVVIDPILSNATCVVVRDYQSFIYILGYAEKSIILRIQKQALYGLWMLISTKYNIYSLFRATQRKMKRRNNLEILLPSIIRQDQKGDAWFSVKCLLHHQHDELEATPLPSSAKISLMLLPDVKKLINMTKCEEPKGKRNGTLNIAKATWNRTFAPS